MIHEELSREITGAAMKVLNELKPVLCEKRYERARTIELTNRDHNVSVQRSFPVSYHGQPIGDMVPDLIVGNAVVVDPKVVACFIETRVAQMIGYFNIAALDLALLINFQKRASGMETCVASTRHERTDASRSPCLSRHP